MTSLCSFEVIWFSEEARCLLSTHFIIINVKGKDLYKAKFPLLDIVLISDVHGTSSSTLATNSGKLQTIINMLAKANGLGCLFHLLNI